METSIEQVVHLTKETIIVTAEEVLGEHATEVVDRIRSSPDTPDALRETVGQCQALIQSVVAPDQLQTISVICQTLLRDLDEAVRENSKPADTPEKQALKVRIVKAKLIAVTSGLLGREGLKLLEKLRNAPDTREGLIAALGECEAMAESSMKNQVASELKTRCQDIIRQLS